MQKFSFRFPAFLLLIIFMSAACARIGNPSGGPRDEDPPIFVSANPAPGTLNVDRKRISILFNEIVNVKDPFSKVVVSPPGKAIPRITAQGRRINIEFDSLAPTTTYTIDFADAIEDNNEGNILQGFAYSFSTGPQIDTLRIAGRVLNAQTLEPQQGMLVGIHSNQEDSAFTKTRFLRVAKTDDRGRFNIRGVAPGSYRIYALADNDNDYAYSTPEEDLAFYDTLIVPSTEETVAKDSVDDIRTGALDTVVERKRIRYLPNDILLRTFNSGKRNQYMVKYERTDSTRIFIKLNTEAASLPSISVVGENPHPFNAVLEASERRDSLVYWLGPELTAVDSLRLAVEYLRTDSLGELSPVTDTLRFFTKKSPVKKDLKKKPKKLSQQEIERMKKDSVERLLFDFKLASSQQNVNEPLLIEVAAPLARLDSTAFRMEIKEDTLWVPMPEKVALLQRDSLSPRHFIIDYPWDYDRHYRLVADSLAATDIYGRVSKPLSAEITTKKADEYSTLTLRLSGMPGESAFVELLNNSDAVVRTATVENGTAWFPFLDPGKYYARVIDDRNGNGHYDTGSFEDLRQPEYAYYYPKVINIKKNWNREETWDVLALPIDMQKPQALIKNRPNTGKHNKTDNKTEEEEEEPFDVNSNPFDPNRKTRVKTGQY